MPDPKPKASNAFLSRLDLNPKKAIEDWTKAPEESLTQISHKRTMSIVDYAIILSSMYGIGAAVGIVSGAAKKIMPKKKERPTLYAVTMILAVFGAYRGYRTVTKFKNLEDELLEESKLEKALSQYLPKNIMYRKV